MPWGAAATSLSMASVPIKTIKSQRKRLILPMLASGKSQDAHRTPQRDRKLIASADILRLVKHEPRTMGYEYYLVRDRKALGAA